MKIVNIEWENLHNIWKVTKKQGFTLSIETTFFVKPKLTPLPTSLLRLNMKWIFCDLMNTVDSQKLKHSKNWTSLLNPFHKSNSFTCLFKAKPFSFLSISFPFSLSMIYKYIYIYIYYNIYIYIIYVYIIYIYIILLYNICIYIYVYIYIFIYIYIYYTILYTIL